MVLLGFALNIRNSNERKTMKKACTLCRKAGGKRLCKLHDNAAVCPPCCASVRNQDCEGCRHYTFSQNYQESKAKKPGEKTFIIEINEAVEKEVDQALRLVENHAVQAGKHLILAPTPKTIWCSTRWASVMPLRVTMMPH